MSAQDILAELFGPSLARGRQEAEVIGLYRRRLATSAGGELYDYLYENRAVLLAATPKQKAKARTVLELWALAPPEHWAEWAEEMRRAKSRGGVAEAAQVICHLISRSGELEPSAIRSVPEHLASLGSALGRLHDPGAVEAIATTASETLVAREWWMSEEAAEVQVALHELIRSLATRTSAAQNALRAVRAKDIERAPLSTSLGIRTALALAVDLEPADYDTIYEALPEVDAAEEPELFAQVALARAVLQVRDPNHPGSQVYVREHLRAMSEIAKSGGPRTTLRALAAACLDLRPTPSQLRALLYRLGSDPGKAALSSLARWGERSDKRERASAIAMMLRPGPDPSHWVAVLSDGEYSEAPVLRALRKVLLEEPSAVGERQVVARAVRQLRQRTQGSRQALADLVVDLLDSKPKANLSVALALCEGLGPNHGREAKLRRAFERYSKKRSHDYTPKELEAIAAAGIELPEAYLSKGAKKQAEELFEAGRRRVAGLAKFVGLGSG